MNFMNFRRQADFAERKVFTSKCRQWRGITVTALDFLLHICSHGLNLILQFSRGLSAYRALL